MVAGQPNSNRSRLVCGAGRGADSLTGMGRRYVSSRSYLSFDIRFVNHRMALALIVGWGVTVSVEGGSGMKEQPRWLAAGGAIGFLVCCFIVYPPRCGWWEEMHVGDFGTWLGAAATFCAALVALHIAGKDRRERGLDKQARAEVVAHALLADVLRSMLALRLANDLRYWLDKGGLGEHGLNRLIDDCSRISLDAVDQWRDRLHELPAGTPGKLLAACKLVAHLRIGGRDGPGRNPVATFQVLDEIERFLSPAADSIWQVLLSNEPTPWSQWIPRKGPAGTPPGS